MNRSCLRRVLRAGWLAPVLLAGCVAHTQTQDGEALVPLSEASVQPGQLQPLLATLDGGSIPVEAGWRWLLAHEPAAAESAYRGALLEELARREQAALSIVLSAADRARVSKRVRQRLREEAELERGAGADVERWCRERQQRSFAVLVGILERDGEVELILQRAICTRTLLSVQVDVSLIIAANAAKAEELLAKLCAGAEFAALAREASEHESRAQGGRLPRLPWELLSPGARSGVAGLAAGQFTAVLPTRDGRFQILFLHARTPAACKNREDALAQALAAEPGAALDGAAWRRGLMFLEELYKLRRTANLAPLP